METRERRDKYCAAFCFPRQLTNWAELFFWGGGSHRYMYPCPRTAALLQVYTMPHVPTAQPDQCPTQVELVSDDHEQTQAQKLSWLYFFYQHS